MKRIPLLALLFISPFIWAESALPKTIQPKISEGWSEIEVKAVAPIPTDISNETQAKALSREAAIGLGQESLLTYVLKKKTKKGKLLSEAEVPSLELQSEVRGVIQGARLKKTIWKSDSCTVVLGLDKSNIKKILKKN